MKIIFGLSKYVFADMYRLFSIFIFDKLCVFGIYFDEMGFRIVIFNLAMGLDRE